MAITTKSVFCALHSLHKTQIKLPHHQNHKSAEIVFFVSFNLLNISTNI